MKPRTLLNLVLALIVVGALAWWAQKRNQPHPPAAPAGLATGQPLLGEFDVNEVIRIEVQTPEEMSTVERVEGDWLITSLHHYPADFDKVADALRLLADVRVGQFVHGGEQQLAAFGLELGVSTRYRLATATQPDGLVLDVGSARMPENRDPQPWGRFPEGQYLRLQEGPVLLVDADLGRLPRVAGDWFNRQLLEIPAAAVKSAHVTRDGATYTLTVNELGQYALADIADPETLDPTAAGRLTGAFQALYCSTIADPELDDATLGFDQPARCILETRDGLVYTILVGQATPDAGHHYVRFRVDFNAPRPPPDRVEVAEALSPEMVPTKTSDGTASSWDQKIDEELTRRIAAYEAEMAAARNRADDDQNRLRPWTFVVPAYAAQSMVLPRQSLLQSPPPPAGGAAASDPPET
jgi:hypothetical protein